MYKLLIISSYYSHSEVGITSQLLEFNSREEADLAVVKINEQSSNPKINAIKLYE